MGYLLYRGKGMKSMQKGSIWVLMALCMASATMRATNGRANDEMKATEQTDSKTTTKETTEGTKGLTNEGANQQEAATNMANLRLTTETTYEPTNEENGWIRGESVGDTLTTEPTYEGAKEPTKWGITLTEGGVSLMDLPLMGTEADSISGKKSKKERNFRYSILGGPGYTPDFGFVVGGSLLSTFKTAPADSTLLRSVMPLAFALTFGQKLGFNLMLNPQIYFPGDRFRLTGRFVVKNAADNYYGVGFEQNKSMERGTETTGYYLSQIQVNPVASFRIKDTRLFVGPMMDLVYDRMSDVSAGVAADKHYQEQRGDTTGLSVLSTTVGMVASYDTRDVPANPYKGIFLELKAGYAPTFLGSDHAFGQLSLDYRQFLKVGERRTLAWTVNTKNAFGDVPIGRMPMVGSPFDLRGYYLGQYRDKSTSLALVEYRHMFNNDGETKWKRLWRRLGFATWAGVGTMGPNLVNVDAVLPNFGAGLRVEVQPRMNFRLDIGYSTRERQTLMYFNMTEAF